MDPARPVLLGRGCDRAFQLTVTLACIEMIVPQGTKLVHSVPTAFRLWPFNIPFDSSDVPDEGALAAARSCHTSSTATVTAKIPGPRIIPETPKTERPPKNASRAGTWWRRICWPAI